MEGGVSHGTLIRWVNDADDLTVDSRENSEKCRNYYDSRQISDVEAKALKKRKQAPVVINRIKPKIDGLAGMERQNRTTARAYPRTPQHDKDATAATEAIRFVLQDNFYPQLRSAAWDNMTVEGTGGVEVITEPYGKDFKICIHHIPWDRIIYDPYDRTKSFHNPRYLGQVVWMDYDEAIVQYPDGEDVLEEMQEGSQTYDDHPRWMDTDRHRVKIVELYFRDKGDWYYACFTRGGFLKGPMISPYKNEEGETEHPYEFGSLFVDREGCRYGAALQYLDVQDEINKRRSKALHLMSVRQVMLERGAVEDVNKARAELARPDGVVEVTPGMVFEVLKTGDMAAAQFNLLQEAKNEIDAVGYNAAVSGKEQKSMSGIALENRRMAGQTEIAPMFDVLKHLDIRVYRKVWNRIKQYWKEEKWIRVTDDPSNVRFVGLNVPHGTVDPTGQPVPTNTVAELDVDIVIDDAPDSVTMQQEEFVALSEMVKSGIPVPPTAIIEASSLKNKDRILQEMRQGMQIPPQVKEQMQKLQQENIQLKANQQVEMMKLRAEVQADQAKLAMDRQKMEAEVQLKREMAAAEIQLERMKAQNEIMLEREKMRGEMQLQGMQFAHDSAMENREAAHDASLAEREHKHDVELAERKQSSDEKLANKQLKAETKIAEKKAETAAG